MTVLQPALFGAAQTDLTTDDYYTPRWLFDAMEIEFDLDVAAPPGGIDWIPAKRYFTQAEDGLAQPWEGRVWMNPPYSKPAPWVERWIAHGNGVALLPMPKSCRWLDALWNSEAGITITGRISFHHRGRLTQISFPSALWAIGSQNLEAIARLGRVR